MTPPQPPPAEPQQQPVDSTLDDVMAMWGFGSSEPPAAEQPPPAAAQPPAAAAQPPAAGGGGGGSTLDAVLANWDAMNNYSDQPTIGEMIDNHAAGGGGAKPTEPSVIPGGGVGGAISTVDSGNADILSNWGYAPSVNLDEIKVPSKPIDVWNNYDGSISPPGGNTSGGPGPIDKPKQPYPKPPPGMNKKKLKVWCRKNNIPIEYCYYDIGQGGNTDIDKILDQYGYPISGQEPKEKDIHLILENFDQGMAEPWTPGKGMQQGELDAILDKFKGNYQYTHNPKTQQDTIDSIAAGLKMAKEAGKKTMHPSNPPYPGTPNMPGLPDQSWGPDCISKSLEAGGAGVKDQECIGRNEAICRNDWSFGIAPSTVDNSTDYYVMAWHELEGTDWPLFKDFPTAIELCIGSSKKHKDTSYMTVTTETATWYLVCPSVGKAERDPKLRITDSDMTSIVNYQRGAGENDVMWQINGEGMDITNPWCHWEEVLHNATKPMMPPMDGWGNSMPSMPQWMPSPPEQP